MHLLTKSSLSRNSAQFAENSLIRFLVLHHSPGDVWHSGLSSERVLLVCFHQNSLYFWSFLLVIFCPLIPTPILGYTLAHAGFRIDPTSFPHCEILLQLSLHLWRWSSIKSALPSLKVSLNSFSFNNSKSVFIKARDQSSNTDSVMLFSHPWDLCRGSQNQIYFYGDTKLSFTFFYFHSVMSVRVFQWHFAEAASQWWYNCSDGEINCCLLS